MDSEVVTEAGFLSAEATGTFRCQKFVAHMAPSKEEKGRLRNSGEL